MLSKIRTIFTLLIFVMVLGLASVTIVSRRQQLFGWQIMAVRSGSMEPAIPVGSVVLVKSDSSYNLGEIVTYRSMQSAETLVTHRVVGIDQAEGLPLFQLKGDNNSVVDQQPVGLAQIVGQVYYFIPLLGYLFTFLQTPFGVVLFILIPGTILVYEEVKALYGHARKVFVRQEALLAVLVTGGLIMGVVPTWAIYAHATQVQNLNFQTGQWIEPTLEVEQLEEENELLVKVNHPGDHDQVHYLITYTHMVDGEPVSEAIEGDAEIQVVDDVFTLPAFFIGTCSTDEVCTPHVEVDEMQVKVELKKDGNVKQTLTTSFEWTAS